MSNNRKIDFLIFYEVKNREYESIVLLKNELCKRGYSVDYFSFFELDNFSKIKRLRNNVKVCLMPSLYHEHEILSFPYTVAGKAEKIVNLRWEQVYRNRVELDFESYMYPKQIAQEAYHCCWGSKPLELYKQAGISEEKLKIVGPMQMDLLLPQYQKYYKTKDELFEQYNLPKDRKTILFISSFTIGTFSDTAADNYLLQFNETERECLKRFYKCEKKSRKIICEWLTKLAIEKDCTVIYRPHPVEESTKEIRELQTNHNIRVISEENIKQWLLVCDQVFSWYSTSFAEAYIAKVPCYVLRPEEIEYNEDLPIYKGLRFIKSYEDFSSIYDNCLLNCNNAIECNDVIDEYYDINSEIPSYIRVANYLDEILKCDSKFPWNNTSAYNRIKCRIFNKKREFKSNIYNSKNKIICKLLGERIDAYKKQLKSNQLKIISDSQFAKMEKIMDSLTEHNERRFDV